MWGGGISGKCIEYCCTIPSGYDAAFASGTVLRLGAGSGLWFFIGAGPIGMECGNGVVFPWGCKPNSNARLGETAGFFFAKDPWCCTPREQCVNLNEHVVQSTSFYTEISMHVVNFPRLPIYSKLRVIPAVIYIRTELFELSVKPGHLLRLRWMP